MNKLFSFFVIGMLVFGLTGCTKPRPNVDLNKDSGQSSTPSLPKADTREQGETSANTTNDASKTQKMNAYVDCINGQSFVITSYDRYLSWVDKEKGPTGKEKNIYGLYELHDNKDCIKGLEEGKNMEPRMTELETRGEAYREALVALPPLVAEAYDYYEQENYKDDAMEKGKEMHPKLIAAFDAFAKADRNLRDEVDKIQSANEMKELEEIEKTKGRKTHFFIRNSMISAKRIVATGDNEIEQIQLDTFKKNVEDYEKALQDLTDYYTNSDKSDVNRKIGSNTIDNTHYVDSFLDNSKDFLKSAKELMRRIRDKVPFDTGEKTLIDNGSSSVKGTPGKLINDYNALIDSYNVIANFGLLSK